MALAFITGRDGTGNFKFATVSYNTVLDMFRIREINEMFDTSVFANEGTTDQEAGRGQLVGEVSGIGAQGAAEAGPQIPAPQNVACVAIYSTTACQIAFNANMPEAYADRLVNQNMRIGGRFISKKTYSTTWNRM